MTLCYRLFSPGVLSPGEEDDGPGALDQEVGHDALELGLVRVGGNLLLDRDADVPLGSLAQHTPVHQVTPHRAEDLGFKIKYIFTNP